MQATMYAAKRTRPDGTVVFFGVFSSRKHLTMSGFKPEDIVSVRVTERPDLPLPEDTRADVYIGWKTEPDKLAGLIQPSLIAFNVQFPYGYKIEAERGFGQPICLDIEEIENE